MRWYHFLCCLAGLLAWTGCDRSGAGAGNGNGGPPRGAFSVPVETAVAAVERVEDIVSAVGTLEANEIVTVKPEIEGRVVTVAFREGDPVERDAVLFRLDDAKLKASLDAAAARASKARNEFQRGEKLLAQRTISQQEFDDFKAADLDAQAMLALAHEQLNDATIRSPLTGFISERLVSEGQVVDRDRTLVTVIDNDPMKIDFAVPERYLADLATGQQVTVTVTALAGEVFQGEVYFIDPQVDPSTRTIKLKARIPNPASRLRAGMFANVKLVLGIDETAVVIPEEAVVPAIDKLTVYAVEDGKAVRRTVRIGARLAGRVQITNGVTAGEVIITSGHQKLSDGTAVRPINDE